MGYNFTIRGGFKVRCEGRYPWPCVDDPKRTIHLFTDDVLTKDETTQSYMKQTGLGCFGILLTDGEVEPIGQDVQLQMGSMFKDN
jgi:hypothetical protein